MKIKIYSINKTRENHILTGESEYLKRIKTHSNIDLIELSPKIKTTNPDEIKVKEAEALLTTINDSEFFIALDERGKNLSSVELSNFIADKMTQGRSAFSFAIGGAFGFHDSVRKRANLTLSLSNMTFPHQLARLLLIEQIYRAFSIMKGEPYHKA
jgi:23S rRNA (pseudouridine1915-N3)-methyltransferase